jgi:Nif-specific regulatory protein
LSLRKNRALVKVNCATLPSNLIESELFGHEKGSFTGSQSRHLGRFEVANGATLFLDEIGELPLDLQPKLLRVVQDGEFERLGSSQTIKVDARIIAATNRNLEEEVRKGRFREDLWYRLNVFPITMPPLRDRLDDVPLLVDHYVKKISKRLGKTIEIIPGNVMEALQNYHWPGNIRELENCMERSVLLCNDEVIRSEHMPPSLQMAKTTDDSHEKMSLTEIIESKEREIIVETLKNNGGKQRKTARDLGVTERILGYKIKKYNIHPKYL